MTVKLLIVLGAIVSAASAGYAGYHGPRHGLPAVRNWCYGIPKTSKPYGTAINYSGCWRKGLPSCVLKCLDSSVEIQNGVLSCQNINGTGNFELAPIIPGTIPNCNNSPALLCTLDCGANGECGFVGADQRCFCTNAFYGLACEFDAASQIANLTVALEDCNTNLTACEVNLTIANTNYDNGFSVLTNISNNFPDPTECQILISSPLNDLDFTACDPAISVSFLPGPEGSTDTLYFFALTENAQQMCVQVTSASCNALGGSVVAQPSDIACEIVGTTASPSLTTPTYTCVVP